MKLLKRPVYHAPYAVISWFDTTNELTQGYLNSLLILTSKIDIINHVINVKMHLSVNVINIRFLHMQACLQRSIV